MRITVRRNTALATLAACLALSAGCGSSRDYRLDPERALAGFREASPAVAELIDGAAAVAVFVDVEGTAEGCPHDGVLVLADGTQEPVVLRCLAEPRAPGGYCYHQIVLLPAPVQVEHLRTGTLDLQSFVHLAPHDDHPLEGHADAPGWIVSTHRSQLLFGDQAVPQQLEAVSR